MSRTQVRVLLLAVILLGLAFWLLQDDEEADLALPDAGDRTASKTDEPQPTLQAAEGAAPRKPSVPAPPPTPSTPPPAVAPPSEPASGGPLKLQVDIVHAFTGADASGRWNLYPGPLDASGRPRPIDRSIDLAQATAAERKRREWEEGLVEWRRKFLPSGKSRVIERKPTLSLPPVVLEGIGKNLVPWRPPESLSTEVAAGVHTLLAQAPVAPGVDMTAVIWEDRLALTRADHRKRDVRITQLTVGGEDWPFYEVVSRSAAGLEVLGIPHLAGEPVTARVLYDQRDTPRKDETTAGTPSRRVPNLRTVVPQDANEEWKVDVPSPPPPEEPEERIEADSDVPAEEVLRGDDEARTELHLRVHGWDGRILTPRDLEGLPLDEDGRLVRENEPTGVRTVRITLPGRLPIEAELDIKGGETFEATVREPMGAELEVFVVDELGQVRPTATISLPGRKVFDVDGGVQRIDSLTDHLGRRRFGRVEAGRVMVHARWGSRHGAVEVNLVDGHLTRVTVVAR